VIQDNTQAEKEHVMGAFVLVGLAVILFVALMIVLSAVKIVPEYERGDVVSNGSPAPAVRS